MIKEAINKIMSKENLTYEEAKNAVDEIMSGKVSPVLISSFLTALACKGETDGEIAGAAAGMRAKATEFKTSYPVLDIVGTGGDNSNSFNISTVASLVIAATGIKVAKHGNIAASSRSGSADCLKSLGVNISAETKVMENCLDKINICFLFAQKYHSAMKYVAPIRKELGFRTIFNVLGPLTNPAGAGNFVLGVFSEEFVSKIAEALVKLSIDNAMVVYGKDGMDELSVSCETAVAEIRQGNIKYYTISPEDFGFKRYLKSDLTGGSPEENAAIAKAVLCGKSTEAQRAAVILNAGAGIYVMNPSLTLEQAMKKAEETIDSGKAENLLEQYIRLSNGKQI